ncbi:glycosyl transferase family 2 [Nostoc linckia z18]|uniref:Glycosyl transferase family 2 n=2 Tax=Nostoc linckia TaxID=92942 RepID=A0A9Q6ELM3_NOSLI|nr:glycosyltransferase family 2 protein [Nostoc linckia]PHK38876.1 glycosyl transferase family 2 [Nostoc linckia z15]PHK44672.1 glycosyl transferase family 2 [Nostoc linckia z16]PHJ63513.1 glycosyl transferase family 2 [Nostoc linckia z1]PHJ68489.1 glycosyl transferase family 2 [Nostoc linckia z3]PHJ74259.1 glycosyl transferase family 2 [Nostoc linckia z2]
MLNIVIPMAGKGSRFKNAGYTLPKPMIPVHGKPMIQIVIENLEPSREHRFIFLCLQEHLKQFSLKKLLSELAPNCLIIEVDQVTEGAACTVLLAKKYINNNDPLMIANCDQWIDININAYLEKMDQTEADGFIMTMWADDPKWSFVRLDTFDHVCEVVEKEVVSNQATVGIYNYRRGADFVEAAEAMIIKNFRVNNEFYVAPAYNQMISKNMKLDFYNIGQDGFGMHGLGTPTDLEQFLQHIPASRLSTNSKICA